MKTWPLKWQRKKNANYIFLFAIHIALHKINERSAGWLQWRPTRRSYCCCSLVVLCLKTLWAPRYSFLSEPAYQCHCNEPLKQLLPLYSTKIILDSLFIILRKREKQLSFLHVYHHATMWVKISICDDHSHHVYFAQVPPLVDWGQICGGRLQFSGDSQPHQLGLVSHWHVLVLRVPSSTAVSMWSCTLTTLSQLLGNVSGSAISSIDTTKNYFQSWYMEGGKS